MRILLTGATGFLGNNLLPVLLKKYEVFGINSSIDLRDKTKCISIVGNYEPDVIIHAAGSVGGILANKENPGKFMYDNLMMGINMIDCACLCRTYKFIMLGTVCEYPKFTEVPFKESDLWLGYPEETNAPYGIAKKTLGKLLETYHQQYGMNGVNLIPVNMYGPCFSSDTEVLTKNGVKNIEDVIVGESIYTLNPKTQKVEMSNIISKQINNTNEWINFTSKSINFKVTPDHNMWMSSRQGNLIKKKANWFKKHIGKKNGQSTFPRHKNIDNKLTHADEKFSLRDYIDNNHVVYKDTVRDYIHSSSNHFKICYNKYDFCEFLGWYISEGSIVNQISISQSQTANPENVKRIKNLLDRMEINYGYDKQRFYFTSRLFSNFIKKNIGVGCEQKKIPKIIFQKKFDRKCREILFKSLMMGDGDKSGRRYTTKSPVLKNDMIHLCFLLDKIVNYNYDGKCYRINMRPKQRNQCIKYKNLHIDTVKDEKTYCLTTDKNHIIYAGRHGKFAWIGQCDNFDLTSSHVIPALILKIQSAIDNKDRQIIVWGTGEASREFLYVKDCIDAISLAVTKDIGPDPINIGTGQEIKISELVTTIADIMGYEGNIVYDTTKPDGQPRRSLDVSKAKEKLGFEAKVTLKQGLKTTIDWFKKQT